MDFFICVCGPAAHLFEMALGAHERETVKIILAVLALHILKVDATLVYTYGGSGFHAAGTYTVTGYGFGQQV